MSVVDSTEEASPDLVKTDGGQRPSSSARSYGLTFATEFFVMVVQVLLYKFAASWLGQTGFSEYALARRVLSFLQPLMLLGLTTGLPRYIAMSEGRGQFSRSGRYLSAALLCVGSLTTLLAGAFVIWPGWFSFVFFGSPENQHLLRPLAFMLVGVSSHCILYAFLRGKLSVGRANALQLINYGVVPLLIFALFHRDVASLLRCLGLAWTAIAAIVFVTAPTSLSGAMPLSEIRDLLRYGPQRLPGDFALSGMMALPAIFAAHLGGIQQAGFVAFGLAIVNMVAAVFAPIGIILLPKVSRAIGSGDFDEVRREIVLIRRLTLLLSGAVVILLEAFAGPLIRFYLGPEYSPAATIVRVLTLGALPLAFFSALRSVMDACYHRAVNTLNLIAAAVLFLAGSGVAVLLRNSGFVLWSFSAALGLLALLTQREVRKILAPSHPRTSAAVAVGVAQSGEELS